MTPGQASTADPRVDVEQGVLVGRTVGVVSSFKGVPYARPPVGALRWRPPQPAVPWAGERDAGQVGAICIQPPSGGDPGVGPLPMSEDCLTLNVWTPEGGRGSLPVMVWIHGGGFNNGSGTAALYDGTQLARRGVMVVSLNYRLGRLGFFDHPALTAERAVGEPGGNYGMMDIVAALRWVRDNAAAFGGDAGTVTVFGQSAGGAAVTRLMISPAARGLLHRAVVQSGLGREAGVPLDRLSTLGGPSLQDRSAAFAGALAAATADELRALPAETLLRPPPSFYGGDTLVIDGKVVTEDVEAAFAAGREAPVPLIIGTNSAEFARMLPSDLAPYGAIENALTSRERADLYAAYGGEGSYREHVLSDLVFNEPARHLARLHAGNGHPVYLYRFDVAPDASPEPSRGAAHATERAYVFDNLHTMGRALDESDHRAAAAMADYWTAFSATGDPNGAGRPSWPEFGRQRDRLLDFTKAGPVAGPVPFAERLDLIEAVRARIR